MIQMSEVLLTLGAILGAYFIGSIPTSYIVAKYVSGIDIREYGSGNVGASNFSHHVSRVWTAPVVAFDILGKGVLPILVISDHVMGLGHLTAGLAAIAAVIGHNWPVFLRFSGGRGVSVGAGGALALNVPMLVLWASLPAVMLSLSPWRDSGMLWFSATLLLPLWAWMLNLESGIIIFCIGFLMIMCIRRALPGPNADAIRERRGLTVAKLLFNRIVFDRDIASREAWIHHRPKQRAS